MIADAPVNPSGHGREQLQGFRLDRKSAREVFDRLQRVARPIERVPYVSFVCVRECVSDGTTITSPAESGRTEEIASIMGDYENEEKKGRGITSSRRRLVVGCRHYPNTSVRQQPAVQVR